MYSDDYQHPELMNLIKLKPSWHYDEAWMTSMGSLPRVLPQPWKAVARNCLPRRSSLQSRQTHGSARLTTISGENHSILQFITSLHAKLILRSTTINFTINS